MQGNGLCLLLWNIVTIFLIGCLHSNRVVTQLIMPKSNAIVPIVPSLHVDDTDLFVFNEEAYSAELNTCPEVLKIAGRELKL